MVHRLYASSPWREMRRLQREMDRLMDRTSWGLETPSCYPAMNAWANEEGVIITAELPGFKPQEIEISVQKYRSAMQSLVRLYVGPQTQQVVHAGPDLSARCLLGHRTDDEPAPRWTHLVDEFAQTTSLAIGRDASGDPDVADRRHEGTALGNDLGVVYGLRQVGE